MNNQQADGVSSRLADNRWVSVLIVVVGVIAMILGLIMVRDRKRAAEKMARVPGVAKAWTSTAGWASSGLLLIVSGALAAGVSVLRLMGWLGD